MRPNWFIALPIAPGTWFEERVSAPPARVRLFHPEDLHLTVAFLGGVGEDAAFAAWALADRWPTGPVDITLSRVVPMGNPRRASALSALLDEGRDVLADGMRTCQQAMLEAAGREPERREPKPHLTVARIHRKAGHHERRDALAWAHGLDVAGVRARISERALYTWAEDRRIRQFRAVARRAL